MKEELGQAWVKKRMRRERDKETESEEGGRQKQIGSPGKDMLK